MSRWIAINCCEETEALVKRHPTAFLLLTQIAMRAKYKPCPITKLGCGQAFIGDWKLAGISTEMAYRHAKSVLTDCNLATFRGTNKGTVATLVNSTIFSISEKASNGPAPTPATEQQRVTTKTQGHIEEVNEPGAPPTEPPPRVTKAKGTLEEVQAFVAEVGLPAADGEWLFHKWEGCGWMNSGKPIKDWKATVRSWKAGRFFPSQKASAHHHTAKPHRQTGYQEVLELP